jgi:hypothetical protein
VTDEEPETEEKFYTVAHYREVRTFLQISARTKAEALERAEEAYDAGGYAEGQEPEWLKGVDTEDNDEGDFEVREVH